MGETVHERPAALPEAFGWGASLLGQKSMLQEEAEAQRLATCQHCKRARVSLPASPPWLALVYGIGSVAEAGGGAARHTRAWSFGRTRHRGWLASAEAQTAPQWNTQPMLTVWRARTSWPPRPGPHPASQKPPPLRDQLRDNAPNPQRTPTPAGAPHPQATAAPTPIQAGAKVAGGTK